MVQEVVPQPVQRRDESVVVSEPVGLEDVPVVTNADEKRRLGQKEKPLPTLYSGQDAPAQDSVLTLLPANEPILGHTEERVADAEADAKVLGESGYERVAATPTRLSSSSYEPTSQRSLVEGDLSSSHLGSELMPDDVWDRVNHYIAPRKDASVVVSALDAAYLARWAATRFGGGVIPPDLVLGIAIVENGVKSQSEGLDGRPVLRFDGLANQSGAAGEHGIMQIMPETWCTIVGFQEDVWRTYVQPKGKITRDRFKAGCHNYPLTFLKKDFNGSWRFDVEAWCPSVSFEAAVLYLRANYMEGARTRSHDEALRFAVSRYNSHSTYWPSVTKWKEVYALLA